ncbi:MAG TPA: DUF4184 family protein [Thermoplasmata archaeon]|nr:DUF4184 family protein [Thermoplasmata archaeon]
MPFTAFHVVPVWFLWLRYSAKLDFVALTVGAVIPDLFEPILILVLPSEYWTNRGWSHSLLGAVTYDAALAIIATFLVARPFLAWADRVAPSRLWTHFGDREYRLRQPWTVTILSTVVGTLSHLLADLPFHPSSPIFFPGTIIEVFPAHLEWIAVTISNLLFGAAFAYLLYRYWRRRSREKPQAAPKGPGTEIP